jgi:PPOX class probable F420-dependent enzyme
VDFGGAWDQVERARVARLATIGPDLLPDLVPVTFALVGSLSPPGRDAQPRFQTAQSTSGLGRLVTAVDHKAKTTRRLRRLDNVRARPDVTVLIDHYDDDDWSALWWVRLHGRGRIIDDLPSEALAALTVKYAPYRDIAPAGPLIDIELTGWQWWSAAGGSGRTDPTPTSDPEEP